LVGFWLLEGKSQNQKPNQTHPNTIHKSIQDTSNYTMICLKIWKEKTDGWAFYLLAHLEAIN
jgi:SUMO ligase MMS21 Smc5/6 complex component